MTSNFNKTKTIAKNAVFLYMRMIIVTIITLFTSRVVLRELGFDDYGLYNVVGGVVTLFGFLRSSMNSSTQRFLSYEMGRGNFDSLRKTFTTCFTAHAIIALVLLVLAETVGLWFLNSQIVIPEGRVVAANWIYQFSVISLFISIISVPYSADIVSNEKMGYFAFLGVLNAVLKLVIAYLIIINPIDRLIYYGFLMMFINVIDLILNWSYCRIKFSETRLLLYWDKASFRKIFSFSGWTIWGQLAIVGGNQGTNILVNMFFTVAANAAMGVGSQVNHALTGLCSNFQTAFKPQITKSYAEKNYSYLNKLIRYSAKISFFLLFLVSLPIIGNIDVILRVWLGKVPLYADSICIIFLIATLCNAVYKPLEHCIYATGKIKKYQLYVSFAYLFELFCVYLFYRCGATFVAGMAIKPIANFALIVITMFILRSLVPRIQIKDFFFKVIFPLSFIAALCLGLMLLIRYYSASIFQSIVFTILIELIGIVLCYVVGLDKYEKQILFAFIKNKKIC